MTDPFADIRTSLPIQIVWVSAIVELGVVWFLFLAKSESPKWLLCVSLFSLFLLVSISELAIGIESCGCAGSFENSP